MNRPFQASPPEPSSAPDHGPPDPVSLTVWLAQGFGVGRIPLTPGTWGSLLGLAWFLVLVVPGRFELYLGVTLLGLWASVGVCGAAERRLREKDPGSVVLDELAAVPLCFLTWAADAWLASGRCGWAELFAGTSSWVLLGVGFVVFRLFDAVKPWPISAAQRLPRGWGVVVDDLLAALCTAAVVLLLSRSF